MNDPFEIVFNDEYLVIVNKLTKILSQPNSPRDKHTVPALLSAAISAKVYPCHRLDRETTGLLIYAKNKEVQSYFMRKFKAKEIKKKYHAFIDGSLRKRKGILAGEIIDKEGRKFGEKPKYAKTFFKVIENFGKFKFIELEPLTGRTNQLRIQLANHNCPILGERKYALARNFAVKFRRLALHASFVSFRHPIGNQYVEVKAKLPEDMFEFLKTERKIKLLRKNS